MVGFLRKGSQTEYILVFPRKKSNSLVQQICDCVGVLRMTKDNDIIICWYDFMGVICWWLSRIHRKKNRICIINILLKDKKTIKNKIAKYLYKKALAAPNTRASVTSDAYGEWLNGILSMKRSYPVIHDVYHGNYTISDEVECVGNTVFCGGRNGRDWDFLFSLAKHIPDVKFSLIMPSKDYKRYRNAKLSNVFVQTDVDNSVFLRTICRSRIVLLPLDTQAPAGLIVLFQAGANSKPVIATETVTTREYLREDRGILCSNDIDEWKNNIYRLLRDKMYGDQMGKNLKIFLEVYCSETSFLNGIEGLVQSF